MRCTPAFVLPLALASIAGAADGVRAPRYAERPGSLEFTGQLIVRPARGLSPADQARARDRLALLLLEGDYAQDDTPPSQAMSDIVAQIDQIRAHRRAA